MIAAVRWLLAAIALLAVLLTWQSFRLAKEQAGRADDALLYESDKAQSANEMAKVSAAYRQRERELQAGADADKEKKDEAIAAITRQRDVLLQRMRSKPKANTAVAAVPGAPAAPEAPASAAGSDIAELPGQAREEIEEAYRADVIRLHLIECYERYERATLIGN